MQRLLLDKWLLCIISWTILELWQVFSLRNLWSKNIDEMRQDLFSKTFIGVQCPNELFPNSSNLKECYIHVLQLWALTHTCSKNNIHRGRSYGCIHKIFKWPFCIFYTVWISCSFQEILPSIFSIFLHVFTIDTQDNIIVDSVNILLKFRAFLFTNRFIFWS